MQDVTFGYSSLPNKTDGNMKFALYLKRQDKRCTNWIIKINLKDVVSVLTYYSQNVFKRTKEKSTICNYFQQAYI